MKLLPMNPRPPVTIRSFMIHAYPYQSLRLTTSPSTSGWLKLEKSTQVTRILLLDRLLVVGSTGLVGSKLASIASRYGFEPHNTQYTRKSPFPNAVQLDITDHDATLRLVREIRPKVIVNTAALTNVDYCEAHKEEA